MQTSATLVFTDPFLLHVIALCLCATNSRLVERDNNCPWSLIDNKEYIQPD